MIRVFCLVVCVWGGGGRDCHKSQQHHVDNSYWGGG